MTAIYDKAWTLVDGLTPDHKIAGYDANGNKCPVINGEPLWDVVASRQAKLQLPDEVVAEYQSAFDALEWKEEWIITQKASYSMRHTGGVMTMMAPEQGYTRHTPVLDNWDLPVSPSDCVKKSSAFISMMAEVKSNYFAKEFEQIKESVWTEWYETASADSDPALAKGAIEKHFDSPDFREDPQDVIKNAIAKFGLSALVDVAVESINSDSIPLWVEYIEDWGDFNPAIDSAWEQWSQRLATKKAAETVKAEPKKEPVNRVLSTGKAKPVLKKK